MRWHFQTLGCLGLIALIGCSAGPVPPQEARKIIATSDAPPAIGPYSQGILIRGTLYCAGQIALQPQTGELISSSIEAETRQVLENLGAVIRAAGMDYKDVVSATVYLSDLGNYARVNTVYDEYFREIKPARVAVEVAKLPRRANVEISCIAVKDMP